MLVIIVKKNLIIDTVFTDGAGASFIYKNKQMRWSYIAPDGSIGIVKWIWK